RDGGLHGGDAARRDVRRVADHRVVDRAPAHRRRRVPGDDAVARRVHGRHVLVRLGRADLLAAERETQHRLGGRDRRVDLRRRLERIATRRGGDRRGRSDREGEDDRQRGNEESAGHGTLLRRDGWSASWTEARRLVGRAGCPASWSAPLGWGPGLGYSPMTAQMKPIMMNSPLNIAMRPRPPYGEFAPSWGTSWRPIPKTTAQPMKSAAKRNRLDGRVTKRLRLVGPAAENIERTRITSISTVRPVARPNSTGREKKIVNSCTWGASCGSSRRPDRT